VASCSSGQAEVLRNEIRRRLGEGETKEAIVARIVERHGEQVLGAPVNRGFGRLAWLGPIVTVMLGLAIIWVFLRRYLARQKSEKEAESGGEGGTKMDAAVRARIEAELEAHRS
jgi:cytochrome c-type biogenesis protein CcmH/NrfF